jgi:hypothetical protein
MSTQDPFTGTWAFSATRSTVTTPPPRSWIQRIRASDADVEVREEILTSDGARVTVGIQARFDGHDYPVSGSPLADAITYTRPDRYTIIGVAKKNGSVSLKETLRASTDGAVLTLSYSIHAGTQELAKGTAILERARGDAE